MYVYVHTYVYVYMCVYVYTQLCHLSHLPLQTFLLEAENADPLETI